MEYPNPADIRAARAHRTQSQAAQIVHTTLNGWQKWEYGQHKMPLAAWELYQLKTGMLQLGEIQD